MLVKDIDSNPSFSRDGQRLVFVRANDPDPGKYHLIIANADGSDEKSIFSGPMANVMIDAAWSPDGKAVVGAIVDQTSNSFISLIAIDPESGKQRTISKPPLIFISKMAWLPDGSALVVLAQSEDTNFSRQQIGLVSYPEGKLRPITADTNDYGTLSVASDGKTIASLMQQSVRDVYLSLGQKADYSDAKEVTSGDPIPAVSWASDGHLLAEQFPSVRVLDTNGEIKGEIGKEKDSAAMQPSGCSDGHVVLARAMAKTQGVSIWRSEADGTGLRRISEGKRDLFPLCSPDAKTVYYIDTAAAAYMKVLIDGGKAERVSSEYAGNAEGYDIARDGKMAVLGTYDFKAQKPNFTLVSLESGKTLRTFEYDPRHRGMLRFSPDGKGIVYPIREKGVSNLWVQPLDGGPGRQLTNFAELNIYWYQWSPDGKSLALVRGDSPSDLVLIKDSEKK